MAKELTNDGEDSTESGNGNSNDGHREESLNLDLGRRYNADVVQARRALTNTIANEGAWNDVCEEQATMYANTLICRGMVQKDVVRALVSAGLSDTSAQALAYQTPSSVEVNQPIEQVDVANGAEVVCEDCGEPKQLVLSCREITDRTVCLKCNPTNGSCPICGSTLPTKLAKQCLSCKSSWHRTSMDVDASGIVEGSGVGGANDGDKQPASKKSLVEVWFPSGDTKTYEELDSFRKDVYAGRIRRDYKARAPGQHGDADVPGRRENEDQWTTVSGLAKENDAIKKVFRPVSGAIGKGIAYGIGAGIVLKVLDTTYLFFTADPMHGIAWLCIVGVLGAMNTKAGQKILPYLIFGAVYVVIKGQLSMGMFTDKFMAVPTTVIVGMLFGAPAGSILGAIIGFFRSRKLAQKADIEDEGARPYLFGLVLPFTFLAFAIPFWVFWFTPKMMEWMSE